MVVEFKLSPYGNVEDPKVIDAQPARIFNQAALTAIRRWRYPEAEGERTVQERLDFRVSDYIWSEPARTSRQVSTASRPQWANPRNECVREGIAYNFGEVVEVGLINACVEPVVLFSCAVGTGGDLGRWRCAADDPSAIVLVRPGDQRAGLRSAALGERRRQHLCRQPFSYAATQHRILVDRLPGRRSSVSAGRA